MAPRLRRHFQTPFAHPICCRYAQTTPNDCGAARTTSDSPYVEQPLLGAA